jgi:hypothetical protein
VASIKLDAFKNYVELRHPEIRRGFERYYIEEKLFFNNT